MQTGKGWGCYSGRVSRLLVLGGWSDLTSSSDEVPFLLEDRPWERADVIAATAPVLAHDPETEVVIAPPLRAAAASDLRQSP
jgi:hypothetical protein